MWMTMISLFGRKVDQVWIDGLLPWEMKIDTRKWDAGFYSVVLNSNEKVYHQKLIVR